MSAIVEAQDPVLALAAELNELERALYGNDLGADEAREDRLTASADAVIKRILEAKATTDAGRMFKLMLLIGRSRVEFGDNGGDEPATTMCRVKAALDVMEAASRAAPALWRAPLLAEYRDALRGYYLDREVYEEGAL